MTDILEKTSDGFFAVDTDWNFTYLNAEAEVMLEAGRVVALGQNIWEKFPDLAGSIFEQNYRAVMRDQVAIEFEALDPKGKAWFEVHSYPSGGGISVFFRDITERKRMDRRTPDDEQIGVVRHARRRDRARLE